MEGLYTTEDNNKIIFHEVSERSLYIIARSITAIKQLKSFIDEYWEDFLYFCEDIKKFEDDYGIHVKDQNE